MFTLIKGRKQVDKINPMIPARALFYALVVSLLIALISGLLISMAHLQRLQQIDQNHHIKLHKNVKSGINLLMGSLEDEIPLHTFDLYGKGADSITVYKSNWGLFSVGMVMGTEQTISDRDSLKRTMLMGEKWSSDLVPALYLADRNIPLSIAGRSVIRGAASLPAAGIRRGNIGGQSYQGERLVYGTQKRSGKNIPPLNQTKINAILKGFDLVGNNNKFIPDSLHHPFTLPPLIIDEFTVVLGSQKLSGNIIIKASNEIIVTGSSQLEDVLLFAPKITFKAGFNGSAQAFAYNQLIVENNCELQYPSVIGLLQTEKSAEGVGIHINSNSYVKGLIFALQTKYFRHQPFTFIDPFSTVEGMVYVDGQLELRGSVYGSVYCETFLLRLGGSINQNHLLNAVIDQSRLSPAFVSPFISTKPKQLKIAKWIE